MEKEQIYLKGFREGFEASMKMSWAYAEELLVSINNSEKEKVQEFINRLKS